MTTIFQPMFWLHVWLCKFQLKNDYEYSLSRWLHFQNSGERVLKFPKKIWNWRRKIVPFTILSICFAFFVIWRFFFFSSDFWRPLKRISSLKIASISEFSSEDNSIFPLFNFKFIFNFSHYQKNRNKITVKIFPEDWVFDFYKLWCDWGYKQYQKFHIWF